MSDSRPILTATFPIATGTGDVICFPGGVKMNATGAMMADAVLVGMSFVSDTSVVVTVNVWDGRLAAAPYSSFQSTGRFRYEVDVTGVTASNGPHMDPYGTAITGGVTLTDGRLLATYKFPANAETRFNRINLRARNGLILQVTGGTNRATATRLNVEYDPYCTGRFRQKIASNRTGAAQS